MTKTPLCRLLEAILPHDAGGAERAGEAGCILAIERAGE